MTQLQLLQSRNRNGLFMLLLTVFDQISGSRRSMLLFLLPEIGPRAAKISRRASCGPGRTLAMSGIYLQKVATSAYIVQ